MSKKPYRIAVIPGDGIGKEVMPEGIRVIETAAKKHGVAHLARPRKDFYPIGGREFWKPLLAAFRDESERATQGATFLHLWHEMYRKSGYAKDLAPVAGSFLFEKFEALGTLDRFRRPYEGKELRYTLGAYFTPGASSAGKNIASM